MQQRKALGKGLASLIPRKQPEAATISGTSGTDRLGEVTTLPINTIVANRQQPRTEFDDARIEELAASIQKSGVIQPLVVTNSVVDGRYELIAGERRLRASRIAGLTDVPVVIRRDVTEEELLQLAIVENVQREDLNAIEEAKGYQSLIGQFGCGQDEVAQLVGKSRAAISNSLRLLKLPKLIQEDLAVGRLSAGHARALLAVDDLQEQLTLRDQVLQSQLSVRDIERMIQGRKGKRTRPSGPSKEKALPPQLKFIVEEMTKSVGTKVILKTKGEKQGVLQIEYYSLQDLDRLYRRIVNTVG